jgi:cyclic-di-GMP-binding protein
MPSFDVVSKINLAELDNAVNQTRKELATRYDFQGTHTDVELSADKALITLKASDEGKADTAYEILCGKLAKRGVSLKFVTRDPMEKATLNTVRQLIKLQQGIPTDKAKELIKLIKDARIKVQAAIQADQLRVTGKNRDDLQEAIALMRQNADKVGVELQFTNFRD